MKRSKFSLSHYKLATMDMGELVPLTWFEALPGDSIQQATSCLIRVSPLLSPVMHPVRVRVHHWFVPFRLLWNGWEDFITGGEDGDDASVVPSISASTVDEGSLLDYLGVPPGSYSPNIQFSALPLRAYQLIYNENYRDKDLVPEADISVEDDADSTTSQDLQNVSWEKDYFTTSRPWEQRGTTVTIPLGDEADVIPDSATDMTPTWNFYNSGDQIASLQSDNSTGNAKLTGGPWSGNVAGIWDDPKLVTDLSGATGISVNDLRLALAIQRYQEARAQYGASYVEYLRYLGIRSSDARLQQPEYLGGGRQIIQFSEVLQTAEGTDPVGTMAGHGIAAMRSNRYRRFFEEHGIVMTLMSVIPKTIYAQGLHRKFSRTVKEDYFQRELQFLGEQEVYNREVYAPHTTPGGIFGYQARYDEYRSHPSGIAGEFRSVLDHWHYSRVFASDPALNQSFVDAVPTKRVNAAQLNDVLYVMANHSIQARRMLTQRAVPKTF